VQMTPPQRRAFGALLVSVRNDRFKGSRKAAYTAAGVNSTTWARAEEGESIKEHTISKIVSSLFPRTAGDWRALLNEEGNFLLNYWDRNGMKPSDAGDIERVLGITEWGGERDAADLAEVNQELRNVRTQLERITYRLGKLEKHLGFNPFEGWVIDGENAVDNEDIAALDDPHDRPDDPEID
jgi:hypothetical protein